MKPLRKHPTDQLEDLLSSRTGQNSSAQLHPVVPDSIDAEVSEMGALARHLQASPSLAVDPAFAQRLERKVLAHSVQHAQMQASRRNWHWLLGRVPRTWIAFAVLLLCMFIGTGTVLAMTDGVSNPDNPLYGIKVLEQHVQLSLANSPQNRVEVSLQIIRDRLNTATSVADASHAGDYHRAIADIDEQMVIVSQTINTLPAGSDQQRLSSELASVKNDARHTLYSLLPKLPFTEQLTTTTLLGQLGVSVPTIQHTTVIVTSQQATITITGTNLTINTRLAVDNHLVTGNCTLQHNSCLFVIPWHDQDPPSTIAVLNEDNTAVQTTLIAFTSSDGNNGTNGKHGNAENPTDKGSDGGDNNGHGHTNPSDGTKPTSTPEAKPTSTPTPHD